MLAEETLSKLVASALLVSIGGIALWAGIGGLRGRDTYMPIGTPDMTPIAEIEPPARGIYARVLGAVYLVVAIVCFVKVVAIWRWIPGGA